MNTGSHAKRRPADIFLIHGSSSVDRRPSSTHGSFPFIHHPAEQSHLAIIHPKSIEPPSPGKRATHRSLTVYVPGFSVFWVLFPHPLPLLFFLCQSLFKQRQQGGRKEFFRFFPFTFVTVRAQGPSFSSRPASHRHHRQRKLNPQTHINLAPTTLLSSTPLLFFTSTLVLLETWDSTKDTDRQTYSVLCLCESQRTNPQGSSGTNKFVAWRLFFTFSLSFLFSAFVNLLVDQDFWLSLKVVAWYMVAFLSSFSLLVFYFVDIWSRNINDPYLIISNNLPPFYHPSTFYLLFILDQQIPSNPLN